MCQENDARDQPHSSDELLGALSAVDLFQINAAWAGLPQTDTSKVMTTQFQRPKGPETRSPAVPSEVEADLLPPLGQRCGHARGAHNGTDVDIDVRGDGTHQGSHIVIFIHGSPRHLRDRTVEYITDDSTLDSAVSTGFEIARAVIDGWQS